MLKITSISGHMQMCGDCLAQKKTIGLRFNNKPLN